MKFFCKMVTVYMILFYILIVLTSCSGEKIPEEQLSTMWEEQLNEKLVFMSKADSPEGELYLFG